MALNWFKNYGDLHEGVTGDTIRAAAEDPNENASVVAALASELGEDEQHVAAEIEGDISAGTRSNPAQVQQAASELAQAGYYAVALLKSFATSVDTFDDGVEELNDQLRRDTASAQRYAGQGAQYTDDEPPTYEESFNNIREYLEPRYRDLDDALETDAEDIASKFEQGPTPANVKELVLAGLIPFSVAQAQWPNLTLSPQEKFEAYQSAVESGTLPAIEDMTETERQEFLADNPDLLEEWMAVEEPSQELQDTIIRLALPVVDGEDADFDAQRIITELEKGGLDGPNPNTILDALGDVGGINEGLALLAPWAAREGVNLNQRDSDGNLSNPSLRNAQDYLGRFYEQTYPHQEELVEHINADGHVWTTTGPPSGQETVHENDGYSAEERQNLLSGYADGLLNLSNHDVGGSWGQLPDEVRSDAQEVFSTERQRHGSGFYYTPVDNEGFASLAELLGHSTVEPGNGLAKEMASTYAASLQAHDDWQDQTITSGSSGLDFSAVGANVLDVVGRNEDASLELITGDPDGLPSQYPENFNALIFDQPWENKSGDNSEEARVASFYQNIADSHETNEAASTAAFNALSEDLTDVTDGNFRHLMGEDGDSAARRNTLLTQTLTDALANHLDTFAAEQGSTGAEGSPLSEADRIRLMAFIASDYVPEGGENDPDQLQRGAARLTAYVAAYQQDNIDRWAENPNSAGPRELGSANGRIQGMLDVALINEAQERDVNQDDLEAERVRNIKIGYGVVSGLLSPIPNSGVVTGPGGALLNNLLTEDHIPAPDAGVSIDWQPDGSHVTDANTRSMLGALVASGKIDVDDLPSVLDDPGASNAQIADAADDLLTDYFRDHPPHDPTFYTDFSAEVGSLYKGFDNTYSLLGMNDEEMEDFLGSDTWGRPR